MTKITYSDLSGDAPQVTWFGVVFRDGESVETENEVMIAKARANHFFSVNDGGEGGEGDGDGVQRRRGRPPKATP